MLRRRGREHVDRVVDAGGGGQKGAQRRLRFVRQRRDGQAMRLARVGGEDAGPAGIGEDRHVAPSRHRLPREQRRHIEQLRDGIGADHTRLMEQRIDKGIGRGDRAGVRRRGAGTDRGASGLERDDGLGPAEAAGNAAELCRVAEALEVQQDHRRLRIRFPVLEQIVAGHVGLVADRREARNAEIERPRMIENREAERAALRRHRDLSLRRIHRRKGRVQSNIGARVEQAHAVGTDHAASGAARLLDDRLLALPAFFAAFAEPRADDADRLDVFREALIDDGLDVVGRDGDHREIDGIGIQIEAAIRGQSLKRRRHRMHWDHLAGEARVNQVVEDFGAELVAIAAGAENRDGARREERLQRVCRAARVIGLRHDAPGCTNRAAASSGKNETVAESGA